MTTGSARGGGAAKAIGLVPKSALFPPHGAIPAGVLATIIATSFDLCQLGRETFLRASTTTSFCA